MKKVQQKASQGLVINHEEGGLQNVKIVGPKLLVLLRSGNDLRPPSNMAKTSSYRIKITPKLVVPPLQHGKRFFSPPFSKG